jgi:type IV pilus assembly protein PilA
MALYHTKYSVSSVDPSNAQNKENQMKKFTSKTSGFTLVEIMIVVAIIALLAAIAIPNLLRAKMSANDALAKATIRSISTSSESFATANSGNYPSDETSLTGATPAYLNKSYCQYSAATNALSGYYYTCTFGTASYSIVATPVTVGTSGTTVFTISTGGVLTP